MKTFNSYVNESYLIDKDSEDEATTKHKACISIIKYIGQNIVDKLTSHSDEKVWIIYLTSDSIDLIKLAEAIMDIKNDKKYSCINSIKFNIGGQTIIIE